MAVFIPSLPLSLSLNNIKKRLRFVSSFLRTAIPDQRHGVYLEPLLSRFYPIHIIKSVSSQSPYSLITLVINSLPYQLRTGTSNYYT